MVGKLGGNQTGKEKSSFGDGSRPHLRVVHSKLVSQAGLVDFAHVVRVYEGDQRPQAVGRNKWWKSNPQKKHLFHLFRRYMTKSTLRNARDLTKTETKYKARLTFT